jgi:hypothetical protein
LEGSVAQEISHEDGHTSKAAEFVRTAHAAVGQEMTAIDGDVKQARSVYDSVAARKFESATQRLIDGGRQVQVKMDEVSQILDQIGKDLVNVNVEGEEESQRLDGAVDYPINF